MKKIMSLFIFSFVVGLIGEHVDAEPINLQQLINRAEKGDVIELDEGTYVGDLAIDKSITLVGKGNVLIEGSGKGNTITITADKVTLQNLQIQNSGKSLQKDQAGIKVESDHNQLLDLKIDETLHGIYLEKGSNNIIKNCTISGMDDLERSRKGNGIHLFHSSNNEIINNEITKVRDGIYFSFSNDTKVEENKVYRNRYGLHYMYSNQNEFYHNEFFGNLGGAAIMYSNFITFENNKFYEHRGLRSFGVLLQTSSDVTMKHNVIMLNQKGVFMDQSNRNSLVGNEISDNNIGIVVWSSSIHNTFTKNKFYKNTIQYSSNGERSQNQWHLDQVGNAWSDHLLFDLNDDGVGEDPYVFTSSFGKVLSEHQLGYFFLNSPSLKIYENVNDFFSKGQSKLTDPFPIPMAKKHVSNLPMIFISFLLFVLFLWRKRKRVRE